MLVSYETMRQIHLDFHTPGFVRVGDKFNPENFGAMLEQASVNSIAIFALCHHGYTYYPSKIGTPHPQMQTDLVSDMTGELKKRGIQSLLYFSQNVNETLSAAHPEFVAVSKAGTPVNSQILLTGDELYWSWLCPNRGNWVDNYFLPLIEECLKKYHTEGIFIDMSCYLPESCFCEACREKMKAANLDINNSDEHNDFLASTNQDVARKVRKLMDRIKPHLRFEIGCFNRIGDGRLGEEVVSEFYLETLPIQVGWFMFPFQARYFRNIGLPVLGMTGRFLRNWGDFGTVKSAHQLKIELATHLAAGVPSCIGDHMHFNGKLDGWVYEVIGEGFKFLKERQTYCVGGKPLIEVSVPMPKRFSTIAASTVKGNNTYEPMTDITGLTKMLTELHYQWDVSDEKTDINLRGALILNHATSENADIDRIIDFAQQGGLVIACGEGLKAKTPEVTRKWQEFLGIKSLKKLPDSGVYYHVKSKTIKKDIPDMPLYTHTGSYLMELEDRIDILAEQILAPCVRSRETFYGHFHGAPDKNCGAAIALKKTGKGHVVLIAPMLFFSYMQTGNPHHINLIRNILQNWFPEDKRVLKTDAPGVVEFSLSEKNGNIVLQAVPFIAGRRHMESFETLNDIVPLRGVTASVKVPFKVSKVFDPVAKKDLKFIEKDSWIKFRLPTLKEHFVGLIQE